MTLDRRAFTLGVLMCGASFASVASRPTRVNPVKPNFEQNVPERFGEWTALPPTNVLLVDRAAEELLRKIYGDILARSYVNHGGYVIMLSMAYGDDQTGALSLHKPEICYPAQGFKVSALTEGTLATSRGNIEVTRLNTHMGKRHEPVTYWTTIGDEVVRTSMEMRFAQIKMSLARQIPDGLLFRVSSIDADADRAFAMQEQFVAGLLSSVNARSLKRFSGLGSGPQAL